MILIMSKYLERLLFYIAISFTYNVVVLADNEANNVIKQKIKIAGCPFVSSNQLLQRNVCLMPDYASNESPKNLDGITIVGIYLLQAFVLEVDESKNTLTVELLQYLNWSETRIRANYSNTSRQNKIKVPMREIHRIWHPDIDIYTKDIKEWKSLYDPSLYQELYLGNAFNQSIIKLSALKSWRATIFCKYDFSLFPFDSHICAFLQFVM